MEYKNTYSASRLPRLAQLSQHARVVSKVGAARRRVEREVAAAVRVDVLIEQRLDTSPTLPRHFLDTPV